jgi:SAM-dependent methyltransferase
MRALATPRTEPTNCPLCRGNDHRSYAVARDRLHRTPGVYRYVRCACGLVFQDPRVVVDDLLLLYPASEYAPHQPIEEVGVSRVRRRARTLPGVGRFIRETESIVTIGDRVAERLPAKARWLDVGCGNGAYMSRLRAKYDLELVGVDFAPAAVAIARAAGLDVHEGTVDALPLPAASCDVASMWWTLEHVPEPHAEIAHVAELLKPGGVLLVSVPNTASVNARLFSSRWHHLDAPRHLTLWTPTTLDRLLGEHGFKRNRLAYDRAPWGLVESLGHYSRIASVLALPISVVVGLLRLSDTIAAEYHLR